MSHVHSQAILKMRQFKFGIENTNVCTNTQNWPVFRLVLKLDRCQPRKKSRVHSPEKSPCHLLYLQFSYFPGIKAVLTPWSTAVNTAQSAINTTIMFTLKIFLKSLVYSSWFSPPKCKSFKEHSVQLFFLFFFKVNVPYFHFIWYILSLSDEFHKK